MATGSGRFDWPRERAGLLVGLGIVVGLGLAATGGLLLLSEQSGRIAAGGVLLGAGLLGVMFSMWLHLLAAVVLKIEASLYRMETDVEQVRAAGAELRPVLQALAQDSQLTERAKSVLRRKEERQALRSAIHEGILQSDWETVYHLVEQMDKTFGMHEEAAALLREADHVRKVTIEHKIEEALQHIEGLFGRAEWDRARREIERLAKLVPDNPQVRVLPERMERARQQHKEELLAAWRAAVERNDIDQGISLLQRLDEYLTKEEATALAESARGVFKAKLVNLGVQFGLAVQEQRWREALEVGLQITEEFPNSRMAREVSEKLDVLRRRAGLIADVMTGTAQGE